MSTPHLSQVYLTTSQLPDHAEGSAEMEPDQPQKPCMVTEAPTTNFFVTLPVAADLASLKRLFAMYRVDADLYPTAEGQTVMLVTDWQYS
ncbi:MAG TPA: hypothetical protein VF669_06655, partial [Tepidisphaeraceae bacterium]